MLILRPYEARFLLPVPKSEWREPSGALDKDQFGNAARTRFVVRARNWSGHVVWAGWFDDRDDADAFLWSLGVHLATGQPIPYSDRLLPAPMWMPDLGEGLAYEFATVVFLPQSGSLQTWTSPTDWNNAANTIECVGQGGGGARSTNTAHGTGGGGGGYSKISNFTVATPGATTASFNRRPNAGNSATIASSTAGTNGTDVWFNGASLATSSVGAQAGAGGAFATAGGAVTGAAGGSAASGTGTTKFSGGRGGSFTSTSGNGGTGGGGAAGAHGNGVNGVDSASTGVTVLTDGGNADAGSDGAGGVVPAAGVSGTYWDATHGFGGGGSGQSLRFPAGSGGNYGGGSGCNCFQDGVNTINGNNSVVGVIVLTYTPLAASRGLLMMFN